MAVPAEIPVTTPSLFTVATAGLLLDQVPPIVGDKVVVPFTQIEFDPVILTFGAVPTVTAGVANELQLPVFVKVNFAVPTEIPFTTPALVTVAIVLLLLVQVPPVVGDKVVVPFMQIEVGPVIVATGQSLTVTTEVAGEAQPPVFVKINVALPAAIPLTIPSLLTVATDELLLLHVPPVVGDKVVLLFIQIEFVPVILTGVLVPTVTTGVGTEAQLPVLV